MKSSLVLAASLACWAIFNTIFYSFTLEDAQITYRYALRFSEGYDFGMWNRIGEPVEGFSTLLWMSLLSLFGPDLNAIAHISKILGALAQLAIILGFFVLHRHYETGDAPGWDPLWRDRKTASLAFLASAFCVGTFLPLTWYATSGMETIFFTLLVFLLTFAPLVTQNAWALIALGSLATATRPEGSMVAVVAFAYFAVISRDWAFIYAIVTIFAFLAALTLFRVYYFGHPLPNTYYAKSFNTIPSVHYVSGIKYFVRGFLNYAPVFTVIGIFFIMKTIGKLKYSGSLINSLVIAQVSYFSMIALSGADNLSAFPMWRHLLVLSPLSFFCAFFTVAALFPRLRVAVAAALAMATSLVPILAPGASISAQLRGDITRSFRDFVGYSNTFTSSNMILWLKDISNENTVIATSIAGQLPLVVDAIHIDNLGLNDAEIAHHGSFDPNGPTDSKSDMEIVLRRRPDFIEGYMSAKAILGGQGVAETVFGYRSKMNLELVENEIFQNEYLIVANAPYGDPGRILFVNRSYCDRTNCHERIVTLPLDDLVADVRKRRAVSMAPEYPAILAP